MRQVPRLTITTLLAMLLLAFPALAGPGPFDGGQFRGRIALSHDGNANDEDDWGAFPVIAALLDARGVTDRIVHIDYNNILVENDPRFYRNMTDSVLGAAERYGLPASAMYDCQKDLDGAVENIRKVIDASSAENPLYFVLAGPMEVPLLGIQKSDSAKRKHVYCISHSVWNDGYAQSEKAHLHRYTKRDIIGTGVHWVQIAPGSGLTNSTRTSSTPEQWALYHWMRDAQDERLRWIYSRIEVEERCDVSDATMTYFLLTGDEEATPEKLKAALVEKAWPATTGLRDSVRIEAENFQILERYVVDVRSDSKASHRRSVGLENATSGCIRTVLDQPYAPDGGEATLEIRYFDGKNGQSEYRLLVGGRPQGEAWKASRDSDAWESTTIAITLNPGEEIVIESRADVREAAKIDYVQLTFGAAPERGAAAHPRFTATGPLDDPAALPGQIIVVGENPGYLKYNGGGIAYLCGPDNPETFLYEGELNTDGTRSNGGQQEVIDRLAASGANAFHFILWRMNSSNIKGEGDDSHSPFLDHDPSKPLNEAVLDQWEGWISQLEAAGVVLHMEFYDDATDVEMIGWALDKSGNLHPDERRYFEGIVNRFKHHRNIIWSIGESINKQPRARIPHFMKLTGLIAETDNHHHPILLSFVTPDTSERDIGKDYVFPADYRNDPHARLITWLHVLPHGEEYDLQHEAYLRWSRVGAGRFIVFKNETEKSPTDVRQSRIYQWSSVMTGQHSLESGHDVIRRQKLLAADGHVVAFMEQTDFHTMQPTDTLAHASTKWVLANPGRSYIAYTYAYETAMGLKGLETGTYTLRWFDTVTGKEAAQEVKVPGGDTAWTKPDGLGDELALHVVRESR